MTLARIWSAVWVVPVLAEEPRLAGSWGDLHGEPLVPAVLGMWTDLTGSAWNVQDHAVLGRIGAGMMNAGEALFIENEPFACDAPLMTRDGAEWVFPSNRLLHGLAVTRRVRLDRQAGTVRYLEAFRNLSAGALTVTVELRTQYNGNIGEWRSDRGTLSPVTLGGDEEGIVVQPASANHDRLFVYALCRGTCASRPALSAPSRFALHVRYQISVPAGESAFLLHGLAQTPPGSPRHPSMADWSEELPSGERERVVNLPSPQLDDVRSRLLAAVTAEWGELPGEDTLFLPGQSRLPGQVRGEQIVLGTPWGARRWTVDKVVALEVSGEGKARLFLRNGEVWRGELGAGSARFAPASGGGEVAFDGTRELRWVRGQVSGLKEWPAGVEGYLETQDGQRFVLSSPGGCQVSFTSHWGAWKGTLDEVDEFVWREGDPWLTRRDGSRSRAFPGEESWTVETREAGPITLPLNRIRRFVHRLARVPAGSIEARLRDGERLMGEWSTGGIEVQGVVLKPSAIRELRRVGDDSVRVTLWDGGEVNGPLGGGVVSLVSGGQEFRFGLGDLEVMISRGPGLSEEDRAAIAAEVARLGDPQWETREAATRRLAAWGVRARAELSAALDSGGLEPEVRHRLRRLLGEER